MPRFYFDILDGYRSPDLEGTELPGVLEARLEAVKFAGLYLSHRPDLLWDGSALRVMVFDDRRTLLTTVLISATDSDAMRQRVDAQQSEARPPGHAPDR